MVKERKKEIEEIKKLINQFKKAGWTASHYPRKKQISISGFPSISESQGIKKIKDILRRKK